MTKNYIPTINISSLIRDEFKTQNALKIIKKIEKACVEVGFFQVTGHGIDIKKINNICKIGNRFFNSSEKNKNKLAPKKWNNKNKNLYRGYFPNTVNGKEGLDLGDLKITLKHVRKYKSKYIEYLDLKKSLNKTSIKSLSNYFDEIYPNICLSKDRLSSQILYLKMANPQSFWNKKFRNFPAVI